MNIYEFMQSLRVEGQQETVDALTVTATGLEGKIGINLVIGEMMSYLDFEQHKPFRFGGAVGWQKGSVRYAEKLDNLGQRSWVILMVTGPQSRAAFKVASGVQGVKYTRCDLAVDVFLYERVLSIPRMIKDNYQGCQRIMLIESDTGDTLAVGSRQSEAYMRIYDKSKEYGLEQGRVYRWEVEYKGGLAPVVVGKIRDDGLAGIRELVFGEARRKSVPAPIIEASRGIKREVITASSADMKLAWLRRQVAPSVRWLKSLGLEEEVQKVLGLPISKVDKLPD